MIDSTTTTLFDSILKGVDRHPQSGKEKGDMNIFSHIVFLFGAPQSPSPIPRRMYNREWQDLHQTCYQGNRPHTHLSSIPLKVL